MQQPALKITSDAFIPVYKTYQNTKGDLIIKSSIINGSTRKRAFDVTFSLLIFILVFSWLFPIIALLIRVTSKGPVFFVQERIGLNGNIFKCYKFRTMKVTPTKYMYTPTGKDDSRITSIGHFLRRTSLDELPQFLNVLNGTMSIVGPRPHPIAFHKTYATFIDDLADRSFVKPGITGLAQIRGYRGDDKDFKQNMYRIKMRIAFDVLYIKRWSFKGDVWIVYTTFAQIINKKANVH